MRIVNNTRKKIKITVYNLPTRSTFCAVLPSKVLAWFKAHAYAYKTSSNALGNGASGAKL